jgi:hypothetical protein
MFMKFGRTRVRVRCARIMRHTGCALVVLALAACGCGTSGTSRVVTAESIRRTPSEATGVRLGDARGTGKKRLGDSTAQLSNTSFRARPALLSERVVGEEAGALILEYQLEDEDGVRLLRAHVDQNGEVTRVVRVRGNGVESGTLADYEALRAGAMIASDGDRRITEAKRATCSVGPSELDCLTKLHRVRPSEREAALELDRAPALPAPDPAAEITAADGSVIYRASPIELDSARPAASETVELRRPAPAHAR